MGMNEMTLAEIEALAERLGAAAKTIRDAQALLGGGHMRSPEGFVPVQINGVTHAVPQAPRGGDNPLLTAAENAERRRLIKMNTEPLNPDDIEALERQ